MHQRHSLNKYRSMIILTSVVSINGTKKTKRVTQSPFRNLLVPQSIQFYRLLDICQKHR